MFYFWRQKLQIQVFRVFKILGLQVAPRGPIPLHNNFQYDRIIFPNGGKPAVSKKWADPKFESTMLFSVMN